MVKRFNKSGMVGRGRSNGKRQDERVVMFCSQLVVMVVVIYCYCTVVAVMFVVRFGRTFHLLKKMKIYGSC